MNDSALDKKANPCGLQGFAFVEFSSPAPAHLHQQFSALHFSKIASRGDEDIHLYQQGSIQFVLNNAPACQAQAHSAIHGAGACAMGFKVADAQHAFSHAIKQGATEYNQSTHPLSHSLPAIEAIGGSVIYFVDDKNHSLLNDTWLRLTNSAPLTGCGLETIDHLTHNVNRGQMDHWAQFYETIFNFREIRYFDIKGQQTGLISRALTSPCDQIKIPLNESKDDRSQIEEFLHEYNGEGIQHIALSSNHIYKTVARLQENHVSFLDVPDTYYEMIADRVPWHSEPLSQLQALKILIDGAPEPSGGLLLQIFTENLFGPVFFEIIQRHGNEGFGEGNFQALFEAIERDQIRRGTL